MATISQAKIDVAEAWEDVLAKKNNTYVADLAAYDTTSKAKRNDHKRPHFAGECPSQAKRKYELMIGKPAPATGNGYGSGWYTKYDDIKAIKDYFTKEKFVPGKKYPKGTFLVNESTHHICSFKSASLATTSVAEQNADPNGSPLHRANRSNSKINGALVPRIAKPKVVFPLLGKTTAYIALRDTNVRSSASTKGKISGSRTTKKGKVFYAHSVVTGQMVNENGVKSDKWLMSRWGNYTWAGNYKKK